MPALLRAACTILLALLLAAPLAVRADDLTNYAAALERAELQYRITLRTLETSGRDETAAEVRLFREAWQDVIARLDSNRLTELERERSHAAAMMQIDAQLVGIAIVVDIGSREAARAALSPIGDVLMKLREQADRR